MNNKFSRRPLRGSVRFWIGWIALPLFLLGCHNKLHYGKDYGQVKKTISLHYLQSGIPGCDQAFTQALNYFRSHGVGVKVSKDAPKMFTCLPCPSLLLRSLTPMYEKGLQQGNIAYARMCGGDAARAELVVHEIAHLFTNQGTNPHNHDWENFIKGELL